MEEEAEEHGGREVKEGGGKTPQSFPPFSAEHFLCMSDINH